MVLYALNAVLFITQTKIRYNRNCNPLDNKDPLENEDSLEIISVGRKIDRMVY